MCNNKGIKAAGRRSVGDQGCGLPILLLSATSHCLHARFSEANRRDLMLTNLEGEEQESEEIIS